jgi:predicted ATPase/DNA-binding CsgD family transcriptional regulator
VSLAPLVALTPLIGRESELEELHLALTRSRLVTVTGVGGVGKTRLAFEAAARVGTASDIDVLVVELAEIEAPEQVAPAIAELVRSAYPASAPDPASIVHLDAAATRISARDALLLLDNCEHVLEGVLAAVRHLLRRCEGLRVLATSRQPLGLSGETVWQTPPLSLPELDAHDLVAAVSASEAGRLFVDRAARGEPDFVLTGESAAHVARICRELDGLPLAIELVAARVRILSLAQIEHELQDRLRLAAGGPSAQPDRHRTLLGSLEWSYQLLDEPERALLRALAIARDWRLETVEAVAPDRSAALDAVTALVDRGLLATVRSGGEVQYRLLETVRSFGLAQLRAAGEEQTIRRRHLEHFRNVAAETDDLVGSAAGRSRLEANASHLYATLEFALSDEPAIALQMAADLGHWWLLHESHAELREISARVLAATAGGDPRARAQVLWAASLLAVLDQEYDMARTYAEEAFPLAQRSGDARTLGRWMTMAGQAQRSIDVCAAVAIGRQAVGLLRDAGDAQALAFGLAQLALTEGMRDQFDEVRTLCREFDALPGDKPWWLLPWIENALAWADVVQGDAAAAVDHCRRSLELERGRQSVARYVAISHQLRAMAMLGDGHEARRLGVAEWSAARRAGQAQAEATVEHGIGYAELALGELESAAERALRGIESPHIYSAEQWREVLIRILIVRGDADAVRLNAAALRAVGEPASSPRLLALADWAEGRAALMAGDLRTTHNRLHRALETQAQAGLKPDTIDTLEALVDLALTGSDHERALRLNAATLAARERLSIVASPPRRSDTRAAEDACGAERYAEIRAEGAAMTLEEAIAYAQRGRRRPERPDSGWESLTPIEASVAKLAADGLTNPEISARLFIARGTVKHHLSHAYGKLGVKNRMQLAAVARARSPGVD